MYWGICGAWKKMALKEKNKICWYRRAEWRYQRFAARRDRVQYNYHMSMLWCMAVLSFIIAPSLAQNINPRARELQVRASYAVNNSYTCLQSSCASSQIMPTTTISLIWSGLFSRGLAAIVPSRCCRAS